MKTEKDPMTPEEMDLMLRGIEQVCQNVDRWLNQGVVVMESMEDERIESSRRKIDGFRDGIRKEQKNIQRFRSVLQRRRALVTKRGR